MRSVLANYRPYTNRFHLITSDFAMPHNLSFPDDWRLGQVPQWLEVSASSWEDGDVELSLIHHAELFERYSDTVFNRCGGSPAQTKFLNSFASQLRNRIPV